MRKILITGIAVLSLATMAHAYTWQYNELGAQYDGGWSSNNWEVADPVIAGGADDVRLYNYYTNGMGQTFTVNTNFTVAAIRFWSTRYNTTNDVTVELYQNVTDPTTDALTDLVASFVIDPGMTVPNSDGSAGSVLEIALATNEYFDIGQSTNYYLRMVSNELSDTNDTQSVLIWRRNTFSVDGSSYQDPLGTNYSVSANRDFVFGFLGTVPADEVPPPPPVTNTPYIVVNPDADTSFEYGLNDSNHGGSDSLHVRQYTSNSREFFAYLRFDLSSLAGPITNATLKVEQVGGASITSGRFRLLGLDNVVSNTPQDWVETEIKPSTLGAEFTFPTSTFTTAESPFYTNRVTSFDDDVVGISEVISNNVNPLSMEEIYVSGQPLVDWLENARTNNEGVATLIIDMPGANSAEFFLGSRESPLSWAYPELQIYNEGGVITNFPPAFDPTISTISVAGGTVTINWISDSNGTYRIESKASLTDPSWNPVSAATNLPPAGASGTNSSFSASGGDTGFFRVYGE